MRAACSTRPSRSMMRSVARPGRHREAVAPVRRLMHVGALERSHGLLEDLAARDHRGDRHVAAAERLADEHEVRLEPPVLEREPPAGASEPGLDLVDDEQRAVAPAQLLRALQVALRRERHLRPWIGSTMKAATSFARSCASRRVEVAERDALAAGQQRPEALLEELVADQRERPERDAVEAAVAGDQPRAGPWPRARTSSPSPRPRRRCSRRTPRRGPSRQTLRQRLGEHAGQRRVVDLHAVHEVGGERRPAGPRARRDGCGRGWRSPRRCGGPGRRGRRRRRGRTPAPSAYCLSKPRIAQHVDQRGVEVARGQLQRFAGARDGVLDHAKGIHHGPVLSVGVHSAGRGPYALDEARTGRDLGDVRADSAYHQTAATSRKLWRSRARTLRMMGTSGAGQGHPPRPGGAPPRRMRCMW